MAALPALPSPTYGDRNLQGRNSLIEASHQVTQAAAAIFNRNQLTAWVRGPLRRLIPHEKALLGFGQIGYATVPIDLVHAVDLDENYFAAAHTHTRHLPSPVMAKWLKMREPQIILPAGFCRATHDFWLNNLDQHQIGNGVFDASVEGASGRMCFIKLFNVWQSLEGGANMLERYVTPLLADIWKRIDAHQARASQSVRDRAAFASMTPKEREVYRWLCEGKSNWEIGRILNKSEWTVKNQVSKILHQTGASTRYQLANMRFQTSASE